jgi:hypothetical protein
VLDRARVPDGVLRCRCLLGLRLKQMPGEELRLVGHGALEPTADIDLEVAARSAASPA